VPETGPYVSTFPGTTHLCEGRDWLLYNKISIALQADFIEGRKTVAVILVTDKYLRPNRRGIYWNF
jgi:hypothetical protein